MLLAEQQRLHERRVVRLCLGGGERVSATRRREHGEEACGGARRRMRLRRLALNPGSGSGGGGSGGCGDDFDGAGLESVAAFRAPMSAGLWRRTARAQTPCGKRCALAVHAPSVVLLGAPWRVRISGLTSR